MAYIEELDPGEVARVLIAGGVDIIQVRAKDRSHPDRVALALKVVSAAFPREGRAERLANMRIVGLSTHSLEQALAAERDGADYIGVGPVFPTATKPGVKPVGVELVREVAARVKTPFFAIGGISLDNIGEVLEAGATRVAVVSAILKASDKTEAATAFKKRLEKL
jgi:thiamine-phosphate pyrophosphorylase